MEKKIKNLICFIGGKMTTEDKENRKVSLGLKYILRKTHKDSKIFKATKISKALVHRDKTFLWNYRSKLSS